MTTGEKVIRFIEKKLVVPEGDHVGKPVRLEEFQKKFILDVFDNPHVTDTAILSIARKNAKTALIAFLVIAFLVGPVAILNSRIISGALSKEQAAEVFNLARKCVELSPEIRKIVHVNPSSKKLTGLIMNVEYSAISAEAKTAHGKSPMVAILDEVGQIRGPQSDFVDAITTAQGAYSTPLLIMISTQAATDADYFSIQIDDALINKPPKTVCHVYAADADCELMDEKQWHKANPALGKFRSLADMRKQAEKAGRQPSFENTFRNLNLNQRVSVFSPFISRDIWKAASGPWYIPDGTMVRAGLDMSKRTDLTAFSITAEIDGIMYAETYFWAPEMGLEDRENRDRVPYALWAKQGHLRLTPGSTVDYDHVIHDIMEILGDRELEALAFDPWRIDVFAKACENVGIEFPMVKFGQGYKSMSPAVEAVEALTLGNKLRHLENPVQTMCAANATIRTDPAGGRKLDKEKSTGRIDGIVALTMAIGSHTMQAEEVASDFAAMIADPMILRR